MRLVLGLFTFLCAVVATIILLKGIVPHVSAWSASRDWQQHEATLINHELEVMKSEVRNDDGSTSSAYDRSLVVQYTYSYNEKQFLGDRLSVSGIDPSDPYLYKFKQIFDLASRNDKNIKIWINPDDASDSVVDRSFRWRGLDMVIIMFIGFGVLGYSGLFEIVRSTFFFVRPRLYSGLRQQAERQELSRKTLFDRDSFVAPVGWGILLLICMPVAIGFRFPVLNLIDGNIVLGIVPLLIGLSMVGIIIYAVKKSNALSNNVGAVTIAIDEYPILVGRRLSGSAKLKTRHIRSSANVHIKVGCEQQDYRKDKVKSKKLWGDSTNAQMTRSEKYTNAKFGFEIPDNLPSASNDKSIKINWWLELNIEGVGAETVSKRYDNLGVFHIDTKFDMAREKRFKNNVVTEASFWDFSTIFLTNGALLFGTLFFGWPVDSAILVILLETALIACLSPFLSIGLVKSRYSLIRKSASNPDPKQVERSYSFVDSLGSALRYLPFIGAFLAFQLFALNFFFKHKLFEFIAQQDSILSGLLYVFDYYDLWLPTFAVVASLFFEWKRLSKKSKTTDVKKLVNNIRVAPLMRMFITTFLVIISSFILLSFDTSSSTQYLLYIIVAFKVWVEYSLIKWGKLEV